MSEEPKPAAKAVVIKKYANRRLYNTATSTYVTLDDLSAMVKAGTDFVVFDAKTGEEITRSVLTQIIFEEESKGTNLLPINFLRQLIGFYGDNLQPFIPGYLEMSLESLSKEQGKFRQQLAEAWGVDPLKALEEQGKRNMSLFNDAMRMFNPLAAMQNGGSPPPPPQSPPPQQTSKDDFQILKEQMAAMQQKLDSLAKG